MGHRRRPKLQVEKIKAGFAASLTEENTPVNYSFMNLRQFLVDNALLLRQSSMRHFVICFCPAM